METMVVTGEMLTQPQIHSVMLFPPFFSASFHVNSTLRVRIGGVEPLDLSFLGVPDGEGAPGQLVFHIDSAPTNGRLLLVAGGKEVLLSKGDRFSCRDVKERRVRFVHSSEKSR